MTPLFDIVNICLLLTVFLNLSLGFFILFFGSGYRKKINLIYFINIIAIVSWSIAMFIFRSASSETSLFWCTVLYITPTFIASTFLFFTYIFPTQIDSRVRIKTLLIFTINIIIIILVAWPGFIIKDVIVRPGLEKEIIFTPYYIVYFLYTLIFFSHGFTRLFIKYLRGSGLERLQIIYLLIGYATAANLAFVTNLILPWMGIFAVNWLGQIFTVIMVAFTAYAILRYRLMDIRIVARKVFIYSGLAFFAYVFFYLLIWLYSRYLGGFFTPATLAAGVVVAPLFVLLITGLERFLERISNTYFFYSLYNYQNTINKLTTELNYYIDLNKINTAIVNTIKATMQLDRAGILLINQSVKPVHYQIAKVIGFNVNNGISLVKDNFLTRYLQKNQKPLVRDELKLLARDARSQKDSQSFLKLESNMRHIEASLCLPLMSNKKLIGIIVLGAKLSGDAYTHEDLELLNTLARQAGTAIDNARLYKQVESLNKNLQQKVDEQTKELKAKADHLEKLLVMRSEFLDIASHQLKTPISVILGTSSMFKEGSMKKLSKKKQLEFIDHIFQKAQKLSNIINDILKASELDTESFDFSHKSVRPVKVKELVERVMSELQLEADKKKLDFQLICPKGFNPMVKSDSEFLRHAIFNLVNNALKYTKQGHVHISLKPVQDSLRLEVEDTGIGIPKADQKRMFQKFARAKNAVNMYTDGSGLGIFIVKKIIEAHPEGRVWFNSREGVGTTFSLELPLVKS